MRRALLTLTALLTLSYANGTDEITIIDKPIDFGPERIEMTKDYIKTHYGFEVENIEIEPKIIVLHWTADMSFDKSFNRLKPQNFSPIEKISLKQVP